MAADAKYPLWRWPEFIAGSKAIVFAGGSAALYFGTKVSIATAPLGRAGVAKDLIAGGTSPRFAANGDLIYAQDGTLFAVPFDSKLLVTAGSSKPVIEGVRESLLEPRSTAFRPVEPWCMFRDECRVPRRLTWVDRKGMKSSSRRQRMHIAFQASPGQEADRRYDRRDCKRDLPTMGARCVVPRHV